MFKKEQVGSKCILNCSHNICMGGWGEGGVLLPTQSNQQLVCVSSFNGKNVMTGKI